MKNFRLYGFILLWLTGCAHESAITPSQGHIGSEQDTKAATAPSGEIPKPVKKPGYVPPPKPKAKEQTYSVVVSDVPVKEILFALARESKLNVDIHPAIQGNATLNAVDQTLPAILERLSKQVDLRYRIEGNILSIMPDFPSIRSYKVNYVNMERDTDATLGVGSEISSGASGSSTGSSSSSGGSKSTTTINSKSKINFWELLGDNIRNILKTTKSQAASAEDRTARAEAFRLAQEDRLKQVEAVSKAGAGAEKLFQEAFKSQNPALSESKDEVIINPVAGTITVMATERQHAYIQQYIDSVMSAVQRQVMIEATIVEVALSDNFKTGIDWSRLGSHADLKGFTVRQNLLGSANLLTPITTAGASAVLGTPKFILGYNNTASPLGNIAASLSWLQTFGDTKVLSSPKIMALNNQPALLKVVDSEVYFKVEVTAATLGSSGAVISPATYTTTPQNVSTGVVMSVTPQINENGKVSLNVRPTISRVIDYVPDPNPDLAKAGVTNNVPRIQVREMESLLQVDSGQTVVLGGLMQDQVQNKDNNVPGIAKLPLIGKLFQAKDDTRKKTELVIFLRPIVIPNASLESSELNKFKQFLPSHSPEPVSDEPAN